MLNGVQPFVQRLIETWRPYMSALLLIHPTVHALYYSGLGDFILGPDGKMRRRVEREIAPYLFTGVQILHKRLFDRCPAPPFSLNVLYDRAETAGRLYGVVHDGEWMHVGTVDAITRIEGRLKLLI